MAKCAECGGLAVRNRFNGLLEEAEQDYRNTGRVTDVPRTRPYDLSPFGPLGINIDTLHERLPICFENVVSLPLLSKEKAKSRDPSRTDENYDRQWSIRDEDIQEVISEERPCSHWTEWRQGSTPQEHRKMIDRQRLLEFQTKREDDWQKFQAQMAADDKKWREEQEAKAEERHQQEIRTLQGIHKSQMWVMGGLVTLIIVVTTLITTVLGGAIETSWVPKWFGIW
jgi:hypothetical protein